MVVVVVVVVVVAASAAAAEAPSAGLLAPAAPASAAAAPLTDAVGEIVAGTDGPAGGTAVGPGFEVKVPEGGTCLAGVESTVTGCA